MKKLFFIFIPILSLFVLSTSCDELFGEIDCAEGQSRISVKALDNRICCPEGCTCLSEADDATRVGAEGSLAPASDTISVEVPGRSTDPITEADDENCFKLGDEKAYILDAETDGEILITLHDADFEELKSSGQNTITTDQHFTRAYNVSQLDPYFVTIVKSEIDNKIIRFAYRSESLFINRISLN